MPLANTLPSISRLRDQLRNLAFKPGQVKIAELGGSQDQPFEQAFSNLAHAFVKDKSPKLLDFEVGFQLIEKNQDNTKAVGVFGFKVGSQWLYAPVFFLNGDLKGHELLYIKNQDSFVPMKENWLNYLLGRKPSVLGEGVDRNLSQIGVMQPHLSQLTRPPYKYGMAMPRLKKWAADFLPDLAHFATVSPTHDKKFTKVASFADYVRQTGKPTLTFLLEKVARQYPLVLQGIDKFYPGLLDEVARARTVKKAASVLTSPLPSPRAKLRIYDMEKMSASVLHKLDLDSREREELLTEKMVVKDDREESSQVYNILEPISLQNPTETGIYDVLVKPHNFEKCLVIIGPYSHKGRHTFCTVIRVGDNKNWLNTHPGNIWVRSGSDREAFFNWFKDNGTNVKSLPTGRQKHILLGPRGEGTVPFNVREEYMGDEADDQSEVYDVWFSAHADDGDPEWLRNRHSYRFDNPEFSTYCDGERIILTKRPGTVMRVNRGDLYVPFGFKLLPAAAPEKEDDDDSMMPSCCSSSKTPPIRPGKLVDIHLAIIANTQPLKIYSDGKNVRVNDSVAMDKKSALIHLVAHHGLRKEAAASLITAATHSPQRRLDLRIKYAVGEPIGDMVNGAPGAPGFPEQTQGYDPVTRGQVPTQMPDEQSLNVPGMSAQNTDRNIYDPSGPDPKTMGVAQQAAQTGQREVFDTAMLGGLLKAVRQDSMVDRYLGDLMKGMDRLGRILFLFYWHGEEFEDRYGKQDMPELEDGLRNSFESMGDIILKLKSKTVEPFPNEGGTDVDLQDVANN